LLIGHGWGGLSDIRKKPGLVVGEGAGFEVHEIRGE